MKEREDSAETSLPIQQEENEAGEARRGARTRSTQPQPERAILIGVYRSGRERGAAQDSLEELEALATAAGAVTILKTLQERDRPDPGRFIGKGKVEMVKSQVAEQTADLLIFDDNLTPRQKANLEDESHCRVIDRTQLILDIFAKRAQTREGKLQVELAQLKYLLPRLTGFGVELSRLGGGIGTRGPGETKLEVDRRRLKRRIQLLDDEMDKVRRTRLLHRERRKQHAIPAVALVGYTNAGKSTLFTRITQVETFVGDQLFATLDPLLRRTRLPQGQEVDFSDTVGFIKKLPHELVMAFRATLEEVNEADLLLHVVDVSQERYKEQMLAVDQVLTEIGTPDIPRIHVFNKIDRLTAGARPAIEESREYTVFVSALTGEGMDTLIRAIADQLESRVRRACFEFPYDKGDLVAWLHSKGKILNEKYTDTAIHIEADIAQSLLDTHPDVAAHLKKA
ncbi:MAG: GTPase HflX [Acidobacteria bacterium]|nr:GTPase HflX [Acidobacteriota bacterium]MBI3656922.1 GTPase HflX [Acidobacteriota bacterium]